MISKGSEGHYKDLMYFNSTRNYTLALLNAFNEVPTYVDIPNKDKENMFTVPISFGNYEKSLTLEEYNEDGITSLNFNMFPRLVLSFNGMSKTPERQTQKYQKFTKLIDLNVDNGIRKESLNFSYNSLAYDFSFTLLLQTRGLTMATQITETILSKFNPSLTLSIEEFPLLDTTETQILISDPEFEIMDEFDTTDINIINVTFDITVRGNIYSTIGLSGSIKSVGIYTNIWEKKRLSDSKLASYWRIENDEDKYSILQRTFNATGPGSMPGREEPIVTGPEDELIKQRPDYHPYEYFKEDKKQKGLKD